MKKTDSSGILEMDDGIISWSLGLPAMSGFGLAIDKNGYNAICEGKLLDTAYSRGFNVLASLCYFKNPKDIPVQINNYTDFARNPFFAFKNQSPHNWNFRLLYADSSSGAVFIKLYK